MATIKYKGLELEEFVSDKPVIFDPPKRSVCIDEVGRMECDVVAFIPGIRTPVICTNSTSWLHFAILPDKPALRRATWLELAKWCATGNGLVLDTLTERIDTGVMFEVDKKNHLVDDKIKVRKWDDTEWHEPDAEYMGIAQETK